MSQSAPAKIPPRDPQEMREIQPTTPRNLTYPQPDLKSSPSSKSTTTTYAGPSKSSHNHVDSHTPRLLSTHIAANPNHSVGQAIKTQFPKKNPVSRLANRFKVKHSVISGMTSKELAKWEAEGPQLRAKAGWKLPGDSGDGAPVSPLFWKMYLSLLPTLQRDPLSGLVPPDLLGSTTTMPLSIISLIPDIMQHYHDVIIRAEKEVFLATNYWQPSNSVNTISQTLKDLSALVIKGNKPKIIVKIMYDRGSWEQLWNAHAPVKPTDWTPLDLPSKEDIPGLQLEVVNFHRVLLGTFHAKFLIVDRKVALINSNNIQDRPNLELMSHLEGPIVDSFYEVALHSWYNKLEPSLPMINQPYNPPIDPKSGEIKYLFQDENPYFDDIEILKAAKAARLLLRRQTRDIDAEREGSGPGPQGERFRDVVKKVVDQQRQSLAEWKPGEEVAARAQNAMHELREFRDRWAASIGGGSTSRVGSRANSRGPSRRASTTEIPRVSDHFADSETAGNTAANAAMTAGMDHTPTTSSPTLHPEDGIPVKSKTMPTGITESDQTHQKPSPLRLSINLPEEDTNSQKQPQPQPQPHVMFLDPTQNSSGRSIPEPLAGPKKISVQHPGLPRSTLLGDTGIVESPTASSILLSESAAGIQRQITPQASPVSRNTTLPVEILNRTPGESTPITPVDQLPVTARMPNEIPSVMSVPPTATATSPDPQLQHHTLSYNHATSPLSSGLNDTPSPFTPLDSNGLPMKSIRWDKAGGTKLEHPQDDDVDPPEGTGSKRLYQMSKMFNAAGVLSPTWATVEDSDELDNFRPHVVHSRHEPFPIAMCCRKPHGLPGHHDIRNPQNAAWLAGFRYAKHKIFVQSPTLNARPIVRAVKQACRRGVQVILLLDLGFNDKGESIPFQGGTNEEVVDRLYKILNKEGKQDNLKVYWYTGKDQVRPLNAVVKQRNCHIKFAAYDDEVMIIGNGNQDSQSWFHSQEVNVMIDNKQVVAEMMDVLLGNQNTMQYGGVDSKGVWRDKDGKTLKDHGATASGKFRGLSGFITFAKSI